MHLPVLFGSAVTPQVQRINELCYEYAIGHGVQQNDAEAAHWYRKAAEQGYANAQDKLGWMYQSGRDGLAKDDALAVFWYQKAADQGTQRLR